MIRPYRFLPAALLAFALIPFPAQAQQVNTGDGGNPVTWTDGRSPNTGDRALVIVDNEDGSVSVHINNLEILRVDENGIKVNGDVQYTGVMTDTGSPAQEKGATDEK